MKPIAAFTALVWLCALPMLAQAQAQQVWRCGADGRSYSSTPCAEGRLVASEDSRPTADLQAAQALAERERQLADRLQAERHQRETVAAGAGLAGFVHAQASPTRPLKSARAQPHSKHRLRSMQPADADTWQAVAPVSRRKPG